MVGIPYQIIHPIDIEFARNQLSEATLAGDQSGNPIRIEFVIVENFGDLAVREEFADVVVIVAGVTVNESLQIVTVGTVADVVEQRGGPNPLGLAAFDPQLGKRAVGEVIDTQTVFEAGMIRRRIHQLDGPELANVAKALDG